MNGSDAINSILLFTIWLNGNALGFSPDFINLCFIKDTTSLDDSTKICVGVKDDAHGFSTILTSLALNLTG